MDPCGLSQILLDNVRQLINLYVADAPCTSAPDDWSV